MAKETILIIFAAACTWRKYPDPAALGGVHQSADWWWGILKGGACSPLTYYPAFVGFICLDTLSTIPISASCMDNAVPP